jgi:hypothetical protein
MSFIVPLLVAAQNFLLRHFILLGVIGGIGFSFVLKRKREEREAQTRSAEAAAIERRADELLAAGTTGPTRAAEACSSTDPSGRNFGATTDEYRWMQTENEVTVLVPVPRGTRARDVSCEFRPQRLALSVEGNALLVGETWRRIVPDECTWMVERLDEDEDGGSSTRWEEPTTLGCRSDATRLYITLRKRTATRGSSHWRAVLRGHEEIDTSAFGPPVTTMNASDPAAVRRTIRSLYDAGSL